MRKLLLAAVIMTAAACGSGNGVTVTEGDLPFPGAVLTDRDDDLDEARALWQQQALADYDYTFRRGCFCPQQWSGPYEVSVRAGVVSGATFEGVDLLDIPDPRVNSYEDRVLTVEGVFAEIDRALQEADRFQAAYHPVLGYPVYVSIDWDDRAIDEEVTYFIENLAG
ncbi:MAG: DUF6174 domain-containing protein [Acidimicrobiia bacterium]